MLVFCKFFSKTLHIDNILLASFVMMSFWVALFHINALLFSNFTKIEKIQEIFYPISATPGLIGLFMKKEPINDFWFIFISCIIWIIIILLPLYIDKQLACKIQFIYGLIGFLLASLIMIAKLY